MAEQLEIELRPAITYGYDPDAVRPVMTIAEAMTATINRVVEQHGLSSLPERVPGFQWWGRRG